MNSAGVAGGFWDGHLDRKRSRDPDKLRRDVLGTADRMPALLAERRTGTPVRNSGEALLYPPLNNSQPKVLYNAERAPARVAKLADARDLKAYVDVP